jgi:hypothetical protein
MRSIAALAIMISSADPKAMPRNCCKAGMSLACSALPKPAPAMPPRLNIAWKPLISGRPARRSNSLTSALTDTSKKLVDRPNSSISNSSTV